MPPKTSVPFYKYSPPADKVNLCMSHLSVPCGNYGVCCIGKSTAGDPSSQRLLLFSNLQHNPSHLVITTLCCTPSKSGNSKNRIPGTDIHIFRSRGTALTFIRREGNQRRSYRHLGAAGDSGLVEEHHGSWLRGLYLRQKWATLQHPRVQLQSSVSDSALHTTYIIDNIQLLRPFLTPLLLFLLLWFEPIVGPLPGPLFDFC